MSHTIFSATGCVRCKITKKYLDDHGIPYVDLDIKTDGLEAFRKFYAAHRKEIHRVEDGIEFPVYTDGAVVRQGVGVIVAHFAAGGRLDGFIKPSRLSHGWIDGLNISGGDPAGADAFIGVLTFLKNNGLKLQLDTDGRNAFILETLLENKIGDRVVMTVRGPLGLYGQLTGRDIDPGDIKKSMTLVPGFPEYRFRTEVTPFVADNGGVEEVRYLTPADIGETARTIKEVTGSSKHPYAIGRFKGAQNIRDERLARIEELPESALFKYRTAARAFQVMTEIEKNE